MRDIAARYDVACVLSLYLPAQRNRMPIAKVDAAAPLTVPLFQHESLVLGAAGRSILCQLPAEDVGRVLESDLARSFAGTPGPDRAAFLGKLARARARGYEIASGEMGRGDRVSVSVPIIERRRVVGNITAVGFRLAWRHSHEVAFADCLRAGSARLSLLLEREPNAA
jgi:DNA-binding IclR family transcriptional regulator